MVSTPTVVVQSEEMMSLADDAWIELADVLDKIPNGYSKIPDGSHLSILKWIFTEEEADLASKLKLMGETLEELATRLNREETELEPLLERMDEKGQIRAWNSSTGRRYALIPFAVGIYEEQLERMDSRFAELAEAYFRKSGGGELFSTEPAIFKVIPVNASIETELEIYPYQQAEEMITSAKSWGLRECICKKQQDLLGNKCHYPTSVCLIFAPKKENAFDESHLTETISMERSLEILKESEEAGLIHCSMNIQSGHQYICNCCTCCCNVLRGVVNSNQPHAFVKSDFIIEVDDEACVGCGSCIERCQFHALKLKIGGVNLNKERCVGCGVCAIECPEDALSLVERKERDIPPENIYDWMTQKAKSRGVDPSDLL